MDAPLEHFQISVLAAPQEHFNFSPWTPGKIWSLDEILG